MGWTDSLRALLGMDPLDINARTVDTGDYPTLDAQISAIRGTNTNPWRMPSIKEALGVPAIQRAVSLIANTTGSLSIQGYRNGLVMPETPRLAVRPDPFLTPREFYRDMAYNIATRGEAVAWIPPSSRDTDGIAQALIVVPLNELTVEENTRNRLFPIYTWGEVKGTRFSPANPTGEFVHITYLKEPGELRGVGPLQLCGAAVSVAVEAQEWAANFYAEGGVPSTIIKAAGELDEGEAAALKLQWTSSPNNVPKVIDDGIESVEEHSVNQQSGQMLTARDHQNGDAARMFGINGALLEFSNAGSSLTYQNIAEVFTQFVKTSLSINYLEPIEQALADLLPRSTIVRFDVSGLERADIKTRFEVYKLAVADTGIMSVEEARKKEGLDPGSIEVAPVPYAPPTAIPASLPQRRTEMEPTELRCDAMTPKRRSGITRLERCGRLLSKTGAFVGSCPRCKTEYAAA